MKQILTRALKNGWKAIMQEVNGNTITQIIKDNGEQFMLRTKTVMPAVKVGDKSVTRIVKRGIYGDHRSNIIDRNFRTVTDRVTKDGQLLGSRQLSTTNLGDNIEQTLHDFTFKEGSTTKQIFNADGQCVKRTFFNSGKRMFAEYHPDVEPAVHISYGRNGVPNRAVADLFGAIRI